MHRSDKAPDGAVWPVKRGLARLRSSGQLCEEPSRCPSWLRIFGATFLVALAAGLPVTLAASTAAASSSAASATNNYCQDGFDLAASPGPNGGDVSLSWCEPVGDPNAPYGYYIEEGTSQGNESTQVNSSPFPDTTTSYDVPDLTGGVTYYFVVKAVSSVVSAVYLRGSSINSTEAYAAASTGTQDMAPGAPTLVSASPGDAQVSLSWTAPESDGGSPITGYRVYDWTQGSSPAVVANPSGTSTTVPGLTNGNTYYFEVTAVNAVGESPLSNEISAMPAQQQSSGGQSGSGQSGGGQSGGQSGGGQLGGQQGAQTAPSTSSALVPLISAGIGVFVIVGSVIAVRRLRARRPPSVPPQPSVRVVQDAGTPGGVRVQPTGTQPTLAVRIEPHPGTCTTLIEEIRR